MPQKKRLSSYIRAGQGPSVSLGMYSRAIAHGSSGQRTPHPLQGMRNAGFDEQPGMTWSPVSGSAPFVPRTPCTWMKPASSRNGSY